jgi:hypothetical protein
MQTFCATAEKDQEHFTVDEWEIFIANQFLV